MQPQTQTLPTTIPLLDKAPPAVLEMANSWLVSRRYPGGKQIFSADDDSNELYIIQEGQVRIYITHLDGRERTIAHLGPGDIVGEIGFLDNQPRSASVQTTCESTLLVLYRDAYLKLLQRWPPLGHNLAAILARRLREVSQEITILSFEDAYGRVAFALLKLYKARLNGETRLRLTHSELAHLAGTSRETVTRVLDMLRSKGLIVSYPGQIEIPDPAALEQACYGLQ
jgi:CRP-like cAMP-binding protein